jgi:hypothetical protein
LCGFAAAFGRLRDKPQLRSFRSVSIKRKVDRMRVLVPVSALALLFAASSASAQTTALPVTDMNFDMWCQETQHWPAERCDRRLPADEDAFEKYRDTIERYEVPYLKERENEQTLNRVILHDDPVDHPTRPSVPQNDVPPDVPPK